MVHQRVKEILCEGLTELELYAKLEIPEKGGVGIENTLLITKEGARSLTNAPLELIIV